MEAPPPTGDPYDLIPQGTTNPGFTGVLAAWNTVRWFWGGTAQQGWIDLINIQGIDAGTLV